MPVTLMNRSRALVTLELNTGDWIHLAPGETSRALEDYEVRDNRYVRTLADRKMVRITIAAEAISPSAPPKPTKPTSRKDRSHR
jgi:hypothetical protein